MGGALLGIQENVPREDVILIVDPHVKDEIMVDPRRLNEYEAQACFSQSELGGTNGNEGLVRGLLDLVMCRALDEGSDCFRQ